ncbi:ABC-type antimicrobial peptide transport system, ATPase component [Desulfitobacterium dichloroeliminans LMG P-21439]|uniref:ABC-type antimicrobial peptide transport system, ATPase component n=1 Tax=Desulfitobacterium dichloroeliminans (strain LMG P-21439 / DCA1) TaxID=871963 RepID=L0F1J2_DESDL|nr:ABC transporter ATP-binding protein [Desulfitobacterium dichloroeliminans]AGA67719.1 ABC-type antimicrobial peptide transport system, ATPase component [Desulfitobacterium dichloroeliminans LMG P-21439]
MQIVLKNVTHHYQDRAGEVVTPVCNIHLTINSGDSLAIYGPSGSGKSTLLFILGCLLRPSQGEMHLDGHSLLHYGEKELGELRNRKIGFMFQMCYLLPTLTVKENILLPLWIQKGRERDNGAGQKVVKSLLEQLGLGDRADFLPYQLSGGQRRRVAMARAMVSDPELILADEPTAELDEGNKIFVGKWLGQQAAKNKIVVIATHDPGLATYAGKVYNLSEGQLHEKALDKEIASV